MKKSIMALIWLIVIASIFALAFFLKDIFWDGTWKPNNAPIQAIAKDAKELNHFHKELSGLRKAIFYTIPDTKNTEELEDEEGIAAFITREKKIKSDVNVFGYFCKVKRLVKSQPDLQNRAEIEERGCSQGNDWENRLADMEQELANFVLEIPKMNQRLSEVPSFQSIWTKDESYRRYLNDMAYILEIVSADAAVISENLHKTTYPYKDKSEAQKGVGYSVLPEVLQDGEIIVRKDFGYDPIMFSPPKHGGLKYITKFSKEDFSLVVAENGADGVTAEGSAKSEAGGNIAAEVEAEGSKIVKTVTSWFGSGSGFWTMLEKARKKDYVTPSLILLVIILLIIWLSRGVFWSKKEEESEKPSDSSEKGSLGKYLLLIIMIIAIVILIIFGYQIFGTGFLIGLILLALASALIAFALFLFLIKRNKGDKNGGNGGDKTDGNGGDPGGNGGGGSDNAENAEAGDTGDTTQEEAAKPSDSSTGGFIAKYLWHGIGTIAVIIVGVIGIFHFGIALAILAAAVVAIALFGFFKRDKKGDAEAGEVNAKVEDGAEADDTKVDSEAAMHIKTDAKADDTSQKKVDEPYDSRIKNFISKHSSEMRMPVTAVGILAIILAIIGLFHVSKILGALAIIIAAGVFGFLKRDFISDKAKELEIDELFTSLSEWVQGFRSKDGKINSNSSQEELEKLFAKDQDNLFFRKPGEDEDWDKAAEIHQEREEHLLQEEGDPKWTDKIDIRKTSKSGDPEADGIASGIIGVDDAVSPEDSGSSILKPVELGGSDEDEDADDVISAPDSEKSGSEEAPGAEEKKPSDEGKQPGSKSKDPDTKDKQSS